MQRITVSIEDKNLGLARKVLEWKNKIDTVMEAHDEKKVSILFAGWQKFLNGLFQKKLIRLGMEYL